MKTSCAAEIAERSRRLTRPRQFSTSCWHGSCLTSRNMKILTAALLAFDAVILGYDLLQIASWVLLWA